MSHEAVWVGLDGGGEVASGLEFPASVEVVDALEGVDLSGFVGGADGGDEALVEGEDGGGDFFRDGFWDGIRDGGDCGFFRIRFWLILCGEGE